MNRQLNASVVVDLTGNLQRQAQKYGQSIQQFSSKGQRHLVVLSKAAQLTGNALDMMGNRYTALLSGAAITASGKKVVEDQRRFTRLGISADITAAKVSELKNKILEVSQAPEIRVDPKEITSALESIIEKTGDLKFAEDNIHNIGAAIQATGASGAAIGEVMAEFQKMGIVLDKDVLQALDILNVQGKQGAFTLANLAALGPRVVTAYTAMGREGIPAIREMGAALQVIRQGTGSAEMAATAFEAVMRTLADPKKIKELKKYPGIEIFDAERLKKGEKVLRPINELMVEIIKKSKGDQTELGLIFDAEAMRAFNSSIGEFKRTGGIESMNKFMQVEADGTTTLKDSARAANDAAGAMQNLKTAWDQFADESLTTPIQKLADMINMLGSETTQNVIKGLVIGGGAAVLGRKAYKALSKGKGGGGVVGEALGGMAGATPVYVVNMPGAGFDGLPGMPGGKAPNVRIPGRWDLLKAAPNMRAIGAMGAGAIGTAGLAVAGAGAAGYAAGTVINKLFIEGTDIGNTIGRSIAQALAFMGNDNAQSALASERAAEKMERAAERMEKASGKVEVEVTGAAVKTKATSNGGLDIDVSSGINLGAL